MSFQATRIECTHCGGPIDIYTARGRTVVCQHCFSQLDLRSADYAVLDRLHDVYKPHTPLTIGQRATWDGKEWLIVGHIRFAEQTWWWDEFMCVSETGKIRWIQYDDGKFSAYFPRRLDSPLDPRTIRQSFEFRGKRYFVQERGDARISYMRGELTWRARVGDRIQWVDAKPLGVEWTDDEIEVFALKPLSVPKVAAIFGLQPHELRAGMYTFDDDDDDEEYGAGGEAGAGTTMVVVIFLFFFFFFFLAFAEECGDGGDDYYRGGGGSSFSYGK